MESRRIDKAFEALPREVFLPEEMKPMASTDGPLWIGYGQTNSRPSLVRRMLGWLGARPGDQVLDVGSGSGWTSALLGHITAPRGRVFAVEKIPGLAEFGRENCENAGVKNVEFFTAGETLGLPGHAPFDKILVSASAKKLPHELLRQLKPGGKLVVPVQNDILEITKSDTHGLEIIAHSGFSFVPLL